MTNSVFFIIRLFGIFLNLICVIFAGKFLKQDLFIFYMFVLTLSGMWGPLLRVGYDTQLLRSSCTTSETLMLPLPGKGQVLFFCAALLFVFLLSLSKDFGTSVATTLLLSLAYALGSCFGTLLLEVGKILLPLKYYYFFSSLLVNILTLFALILIAFLNISPNILILPPLILIFSVALALLLQRKNIVWFVNVSNENLFSLTLIPFATGLLLNLDIVLITYLYGSRDLGSIIISIKSLMIYPILHSVFLINFQKQFLINHELKHYALTTSDMINYTTLFALMSIPAYLFVSYIFIPIDPVVVIIGTLGFIILSKFGPLISYALFCKYERYVLISYLISALFCAALYFLVKFDSIYFLICLSFLLQINARIFISYFIKGHSSKL